MVNEDKKTIPHGPFMASKIWNDLVELFRNGMVCKKHWHRFKVIQNCFTANEAVDWLLNLLQSHKTFGKHVTKEQTTKLLQKFLKFHVIEDISGRHGSEDFSCNKKLYRFPAGRVSKFVTENKKRIALKEKDLNQNERVFVGQSVKYCATEDSVSLQVSSEKPKITKLDAIKFCFHKKISLVLHIKEDEDKSENILIRKIVNNSALMKNVAMNLNEDECKFSSLKNNPNEATSLEFWVLQAMKSLASWPNYDVNEFPPYNGFEKDVFKAICDYFNVKKEPIVTFDMYNTFIDIYQRCISLDGSCQDTQHSFFDASDENDGTSVDSKVVEDIKKRLFQAKLRHENKANRKKRNQRRFIVYNDAEENGYEEINKGAHNTSIHQSLHDLSRLGQENTKYSTLGRNGMYNIGSSKLDKSVRKKCASHHYLNTPNYYGVNSNYHDINSNKNTQALVTFTPLAKGDNQAQVMSSVDNLLMDMSCCGDGFKFADVGITSTPTRCSQKTQNYLCANIKKEHEEVDLIGTSLSSRSDEDSNHLSIKLRSRASSDVDISLSSNSNQNAYSQEIFSTKQTFGGVVKTNCDLTASLRHAPPAKSTPNVNLLDHCCDWKQRVVTTSNLRRKYPTRSHSNLGASRRCRNKRAGNQMSSRPLSMIEQSPNKAKEDMCGHMANENLNSPLSAAVNQAKIQMTSRLHKRKTIHACEAFQLCLLVLPPTNRKNLLLLLRFVNKVLNNPYLQNLDEVLTTKDLIIEKFSSTVLKNEDMVLNNESLNRQFFTFLLQNSKVLFSNPPCLSKIQISEKLKEMEIEQIRKTKELENLKNKLEFCQQIYEEEYENQKNKKLEQDSLNILKQICRNESLSSKERKRKLKEFQKLHPVVYARHAKKIIFDEIAQKKTPFDFAIEKLRQIRL